MPVSIKTELDELAERAKSRLPGESVMAWLADVALEAVDVVTAGIAAFDAVDKTADLKNVEAELTAAVLDLAELVDLPWWVSQALRAVPLIMDRIVAKIGEYSDRIEEFKQTFVLPIFAGAKEFGERGLEKLAA